MPVLFAGHGSPMNALEDNAWSRGFRSLGALVPRPRAILAVSAHWYVRGTYVTGNARPETIHDFGGFPEALYRMRYEPPGAPMLATRAGELLAAIGQAPAVDPDRGIDHGGWVPLRWMYPDADIPVTQLSIQSELGARHHLEIGRALAPLRDEGVLVIGSGGIVHNLGELDWEPGERAPMPWAAAFAEWMADKTAQGADDELADYRKLAPNAERAHPTEDHLVPFFVALGAGGAPARRMNLGFDMGSLGMDCYAFGG